MSVQNEAPAGRWATILGGLKLALKGMTVFFLHLALAWVVLSIGADLWNETMPELFGVGEISALQLFSLLALLWGIRLGSKYFGKYLAEAMQGMIDAVLDRSKADKDE